MIDESEGVQMFEPVGVVCRLKVDGAEREYVVTARVLCDRVKHALRREVKDRKSRDIKETIDQMASFRKQMAAADYAELNKQVMEKLASKMVDAGRASEEEAFDALQSQRGCAIAFHEGVEDSPAELKDCLGIMEDSDNYLRFLNSLGDVMKEQEAALGNSTSPTMESRDEKPEAALRLHQKES